MKFLSFLFSRLVKIVVVILGVVVVNFVMIHLAPGDPAAIMAGESGASDPTYVNELRAKFGLDLPIAHNMLPVL